MNRRTRKKKREKEKEKRIEKQHECEELVWMHRRFTTCVGSLLATNQTVIHNWCVGRENN